MSFWAGFLHTLWLTMGDVAPIVMIFLFFQVVVIRRKLPDMWRIFVGFVCVVIGMSLFIIGLEKALFPLGDIMAKQLTAPEFLFPGRGVLPEEIRWQDYHWVYVFAAAIGFASTLAEPALIAVAIKAEEVSGGTIGVWGLRIAVAVGVAIGLTLGTFRIVTGTPLHYYIVTAYMFALIQTYFAPRSIIPLAYDSGGVTTSTVTVPLVAALGLGLASTIPGRSPIIDGFGLIAFASVFPIISVMAYVQLNQWRQKSESKALN
jgi:hypothetical protein